MNAVLFEQVTVQFQLTILVGSFQIRAKIQPSDQACLSGGDFDSKFVQDATCVGVVLRELYAIGLGEWDPPLRLKKRFNCPLDWSREPEEMTLFLQGLDDAFVARASPGSRVAGKPGQSCSRQAQNLWRALRS